MEVLGRAWGLESQRVVLFAWGLLLMSDLDLDFVSLGFSSSAGNMMLGVPFSFLPPALITSIACSMASSTSCLGVQRKRQTAALRLSAASVDYFHRILDGLVDFLSRPNCKPVQRKCPTAAQQQTSKASASASSRARMSLSDSFPEGPYTLLLWN